MAQQLIGTSYKDMDAEYQDSVSRQEYRNRRQNQVDAKDRVQKFGSAGKAKQKTEKEAYGVGNLQDFDLAGTGTGSALSRIEQDGKGYEKGADGAPDQFGRGKERLSLRDVRQLWMNGVDKGGEGQEGRFSLGELQEYGNSLGKGQTFGKNAQAFLDNKIAELGADAKFTSGMKRGRGDLGTGGGGDTGGGSTNPDMPEDGDTTIGIDVDNSIDASQEQSQEVTQVQDNSREYVGGTVSVGGDNNGIIDNSVNDLSINYQTQKNSQTQNGHGTGGANSWLYNASANAWDDNNKSLLWAMGLNNNTLARTDLRLKDANNESFISHQNTNALVNGHGQNAVDITDNFGNLGTITSGSLLSALGPISRFVPTAAERIEPTYDDDDD